MGRDATGAGSAAGTGARGVPAAEVERLSERLSLVTDLRLPHAMESRGDPVTCGEKKDHLASLLQRDPAVFLERYGGLLREEELRAFDGMAGDYEIAWHMRRLRPANHPSSSHPSAAAVVKNRRLAFMTRLEQEGVFFSEEAMRERDPLLHQDYLGGFDRAPGAAVVAQAGRGEGGEEDGERGGGEGGGAGGGERAGVAVAAARGVGGAAEGMFVARPGERLWEMLLRQTDEVAIQQALVRGRRAREGGVRGRGGRGRMMEEEEEEEDEEEEEEEEGEEEEDDEEEEEEGGMDMNGRRDEHWGHMQMECEGQGEEGKGGEKGEEEEGGGRRSTVAAAQGRVQEEAGRLVSEEGVGAGAVRDVAAARAVTAGVAAAGGARAGVAAAGGARAGGAAGRDNGSAGDERRAAGGERGGEAGRSGGQESAARGGEDGAGRRRSSGGRQTDQGRAQEKGQEGRQVEGEAAGGGDGEGPKGQEVREDQDDREGREGREVWEGEEVWEGGEDREGALEELRWAMKEKFLAGRETDVDYGRIDGDESLDDDWMTEVNRDAEERYFGAD
ncbi:unnamed protein product [Closterium sp. NIES-65]|nr:unnamed protein product [Closterium sp. NIES-65]